MVGDRLTRAPTSFADLGEASMLTQIHPRRRITQALDVQFDFELPYLNGQTNIKPRWSGARPRQKAPRRGICDEAHLNQTDRRTERKAEEAWGSALGPREDR
ncbi:hypothetical protein D9M68_901880 [compost metagenome]